MSENPVNALAERFESQERIISELQENFNLVQAQYAQLAAEDKGWQHLFGGNSFEKNTGIDLETLKAVSERLKESIAGSGLPKRANELRYSYTFGRAFIFPGVEQDADLRKKKGAGAPKKEQRFFEKPLNQRYAFGEDAQFRMNAATSTDGVYLFLGDNTEKTGRAIPISEITAIYLNPDYSDEVWAYQRTWDSQNAKGETVTMVRWYLTDRFEGTKPKTIGTDPEKNKVDLTKTIIDFTVSPQVGFALGVPDLMAGEIWNKKYLTLMAHGEEVSAVLATYAAKVKVQSKAGASNVGVKTGKAGVGGPKAMAYGEGNAIDVFQSLGKTYDFGGLRPIASMYAASVGISVVDALADPAAAGASYSAAQALAPSERRSIESRRAQWAAWYERLFKWGTGETIKVTPVPLDDVEPYRKSQILGLAWNSGLVHPDELRPEFLRVAGLTSRHEEAPENVLLPNNSDSWERNDIDPNADPNSAPGGTGTTTHASSPDQGRSTGNGGADSTLNNDTRTDKVGESLKRMADEDLLARWEAVAARLENSSQV